MSSLACYRYKTPVLTGPWRRLPDRAIDDAVRARQARLDEQGEVTWEVAGAIERSECRHGAPCRGVYPTE